MSNLIRYVLVSLCSFAVASPPALCCLIDLRSCYAAPAKEQQKAKSKCSHCCSDEPTPAPRKRARAPKPTAPMSECCSDRQPATPLTSPSPLPHPDLLVGIQSLVDTTCPASAGHGNAALREPIVSSPLPHVRNCLWLC
jgi:hypothetical protein